MTNYSIGALETLYNNINNNNNNNNNNFETLGPMNLSALNLLNDLGRKISSVSGDDREGHFLFQRLSVIVQRYNAVLHAARKFRSE